MAIQVSSNFLVGVKKFLDSRQSVKTIAELNDINTNFIPDGFIVYCEEDNNHYRYIEDKYTWTTLDMDISEYLYELDENGDADFDKPIYIKDEHSEIIDLVMVQGWVEDGATIGPDDELRNYIIDDFSVSLDTKTYSSETIVSKFENYLKEFKTYAKEELARLDNIKYIKINDVIEMDRTDVFYLLEDNEVLGTFQIYILDETGTAIALGSSEMDISGFQPLRDARLQTTSKGVVDAINEINERHEKVEEQIGSVSNLIVQQQDSLLNSCDYLYSIASKIGDLTKLTTVAKLDLISSINELYSEIGELKDLKMTDQTNIVLAMNSFLSEIINVGTIIPYAGNVVPPGYLICDGQTYYSKDYPFLAKMLNPGGTTFSVPNFCGRVVFGTNDEYGVNSSGGSAAVALTSSNLPSHTHGATTTTSHYHSGTTSTGKASYWINTTGSIVLKDRVRNVLGSETCRHTHTVYFKKNSHTHTMHYAGYGYGLGMGSSYEQCPSIKNSGTAYTHNNMQPSLVLRYLIKY